MKRLWLLILTVIPFVNVNAISTYYSDYRDYKLGTEEVLELDDTLKKEDYRVYNTQVLVKQDLGYVPDNSCPYHYTDNIKVHYTVKPRGIDMTKKWYQSIDIKDGMIYKISFLNILDNTVIEMRIFNNNTQIRATTSNDLGEINNIVDNDDFTFAQLFPNETYEFSFEPLPARNLRVEFISLEKMSGIFTFYYTDGTIDIRRIYADEFDVKDTGYLNEIIPIVGYMNGTSYANSYEKDETLLYHCYDMVKESTGIYKKEDEYDRSNEYIDVDDYKDLHDYYIRDKVKISDKQITSNNFNLKDLVTYSTVENFRIEDNIDYSTNGVYPVKFIFNDDFIVEKDVKVNIAKNNTTKTTTIPVTTTSSVTKKSTTTTVKSTTTKSTTIPVTTTSNVTKKSTTTTTKPTTTTTTSIIPKTTTSNTTAINETTTKPSSTSSTKKTTTINVKANETCPTYNTYDDDVLEVEPLKAVCEKEEEKDDKKDKVCLIIKIILWILLIILVIILIIDKIRDKNKDSC
jgi:hypothetical protein